MISMKVTLMHGAGGEVMGELLQTLTKFRHNNAGGIGLEALDDGAVIPLNGMNLVFTTDSHVVRPIFFPGGDIGRITVCGTINDLTMMGGRPLALSCGMIIEEGFDISDLARIVASMDEALGEAGASLVTGDTKVMERGALDGIVINTAGIGIAKHIVRDNGLMPGDAIIVSGTLGDHGIAIMAHREGFDLGEQIRSDVAPLWGMVEPVLDAGHASRRQRCRRPGGKHLPARVGHPPLRRLQRRANGRQAQRRAGLPRLQSLSRVQEHRPAPEERFHVGAKTFGVIATKLGKELPFPTRPLQKRSCHLRAA